MDFQMFFEVHCPSILRVLWPLYHRSSLGKSLQIFSDFIRMDYKIKSGFLMLKLMSCNFIRAYFSSSFFTYLQIAYTLCIIPKNSEYVIFFKLNVLFWDKYRFTWNCNFTEILHILYPVSPIRSHKTIV